MSRPLPCPSLALVLLALLGLSACNVATLRTTPTPSPSLSSPVESRDRRAIEGVYAEADDALAQGEKALAAWRDGNTTATAEGLARARARLYAAARRCASVPGCNVERVARVQSALLDRQSRTLFGVAEGDDDPLASADGRSPLLDTLPESERSVNLLKGRDLRELIEVNEAIRAGLREWLTWMRPQLLDTYEYYQYMRYKMWPAYQSAGLPEALLFGILAKESGGKVHAVSSAGASGPLQFMPATGLRYGLGVSEGFDSRFDPAEAARANVAYLNDQFARLNDDIELVLAAYNGGEGRMGRLSPKGKRRFWDPRVFNNLPPETRQYVPMVLAAAWLFLHPEEYGLRWPAIDGRPGSLALDSALSLNELSICLGQEGAERGWFRTLRNLNPRWDPNKRLPRGTTLEVPARAVEVYAARCTDGAALARVQALQDAELPGMTRGPLLAGGVRMHTVGKGETLSVIARKLGCGSVKDIAAANQIRAPRYAIRAGQRLRVPGCRA